MLCYVPIHQIEPQDLDSLHSVKRITLKLAEKKHLPPAITKSVLSSDPLLQSWGQKTFMFSTEVYEEAGSDQACTPVDKLMDIMSITMLTVPIEVVQFNPASKIPSKWHDVECRSLQKCSTSLWE